MRIALFVCVQLMHQTDRQNVFSPYLLHHDSSPKSIKFVQREPAVIFAAHFLFDNDMFKMLCDINNLIHTC